MLLWLLQNTVLAALLAVGVAVVCRVARPNPAVRHALWLIVLVRLLLPPGLHWPWALPDPLSRPEPVVVRAEPDPVPDLPVSNGDTEYLLAQVEVMDVPVTPVEAAVPAIAPSPFPWSKWLARATLAVWGIGAIVVLLRHMQKVQRLRRWLRLAEPAPTALIQRVHELAGKLRIRAPRVAMVRGLSSPLVGGLPRPVLLWPAGLEDQLPPEGVRAVLAHELAHLRRRDHWVRWLELFAGCVMWWNPLFILVRRKIRQYAEQACDAWVVNLLPKARRAYAEALLTVCETVSRVAEPAPALGIGGDDRRDFQRRLTMILRDPVACRPTRRTLLAIGFIALMAVPGWTLGQNPAENPADKETAIVIEDSATTIAVQDVLIELLGEADAAKGQDPSEAREKKLQELEEKIQGLLKEIQALKSEKQKTTASNSKMKALKEKVAGKVQTEEYQLYYGQLQLAEQARAAEALARARAEAEAEKLRAVALEAQARAELAKAQAEKLHLDAKKSVAEFFYKSAAEKERKEAELRLRYSQLKEEQAKSAEGRPDRKFSLATYTLPAEKAESLSKFLAAQLKGYVEATEVNGGKLIVYATPEAQKAIAQLVELVRGRSVTVKYLVTPPTEKPK